MEVRMNPSAKGNGAEIESMLVIHQGAIGDFILALPVLSALRRAFPKARPFMMGYPRILQLAEGRFYAEEVFSIDQKGMATFFVREGSLDRGLSDFFSAFELIVVFGRDRDGALIGNLKRVCKGQIFHINPLPKWDEGVHLSDYLLKQLTQYEVPLSKTVPRLYLRESDREWAKNFWTEKGIRPEGRSQVIILHPGSGSRKKIWPLKRFLGFLHHLETQLAGPFLIILGPAEGPEVQRAFEERGSPHLIFAKGLSLVQLASVMEGCRLFIGNDSGISHMAVALGLPTIAIFGPTDHRVWSPRGEKVEVVRQEVPCSPCAEERFFLCKDLQCLHRVEISDVLKSIQSIGLEV
ncbi:MAG: glycosyltransferase family 9 protein [Deltaproteobacteria bacterium]|nr:glycosyltransferase family 9 protein [Deltaproteobacteria bacterium]MBM4338782.1 glycosyltransferase family 9 protein [Deltaproteobacteria bacterium]